MPELLIELFSEEIPARMQLRGAATLERAVNKALLDAGLMPEGVKAFAGARRLSLVATGLPARQPDRREEKKGPRVGAPERAVAGFLKSAGLSSLDECERRTDKKGEFYVAVIDQAGSDTAALVAGFMPDIIAKFSWPKSMRWGDSDLRWVRPLHRILCVFDGEVVDFKIGALAASDKTEGHRFMAPGEIQTRSFDDYSTKLRAAKVILDTEERKEIIAGDAATLCQAQGLELVEDAGLLSEVAGLSEWPTAMIGAFDEKFLTLPDEVLTASMRGHQKYFSVRDPNTGGLANRFVCVANIEAPDGGKAMREGYERVLTARLSDAWYLYNQDRKINLEDRVKELDKVTFFEGLGSVGDKARRVAALAKEIAGSVGADPETAARAALLAKADLVTGMVKEFPELQGVMGRYYALEEGESADIADAIRDHYKPAGADDAVPAAPVSVAVALADKIDTLTAFWAIDKKPTGSSDPFALRRAALGVIQTVLTVNTRISVWDCIEEARDFFINALYENGQASLVHELDNPDFGDDQGTVILYSANPKYDSNAPGEKSDTLILLDDEFYVIDPTRKYEFSGGWAELEKAVLTKVIPKSEQIPSLLAFFHDRLKVYLKDKGHRHDAIDAVRVDADGNLQDDLVLIVAKLTALEAFLKTDDGANLAAAYKRAVNILRAEEKKGALPDTLIVDAGLLKEPQEKSFFAALCDAEAKVEKAVASEDFEAAMTALAALRAPVDHFFDKVTVNADDAALRANRLALLTRLRAATARVADFSKLEG
ncbi:MAG: glycine--tRNA ligase subunit beta [Alphaproteobacteria bacterium]|nr:glycine--tRNA ligase subunit beta [Alphaproteobacteria bacterium]